MVLLNNINNVGIKSIVNAETLMAWHREFRNNNGLFCHPYETYQSFTPYLFREFPMAKEIARSYLNNKLEKISCEYAAVYFKSPEFLDPILVEELRDDEGNDTFSEMDDEYKQNQRDYLLLHCNVPVLSTTTAGTWLKFLGFKFKAHERCFYTDRHESQEQLIARSNFLKKYFPREILKYKWAILTDDQAKQLEDDEDEPLRKNVFYRRPDGKREYHISVHSKLINYVSQPNRTKHGGDLSVRKPANQRPVIEVGQDEAIFDQYAFTSRTWHGSEGQTTMRPKGTGDGLMASAMVGPSLGFGYNANITFYDLMRINENRRGNTTLTKKVQRKYKKEALQRNNLKMLKQYRLPFVRYLNMARIGKAIGIMPALLNNLRIVLIFYQYCFQVMTLNFILIRVVDTRS